MKKAVALIASAVLLFAACGREGQGTDTTLTATTQDETTPTPTAKAVASGRPGATTGPGGTTSTTAPTTTKAPAATSAPVAKAPEGRSNRPKDGTYMYAVNGESTNPFNPSAPPEKYSGEQTNDVSHQGDVYTTETTNSESPGRTTIRTRWSADRVVMLSLKSETSGGEFSCTFNPPLLITKFPIKPETYPTQQLKGEGNACDGTLDITIVRKETAKDATGKVWPVWNVRVKLTIKSDQFTLTTNETRYVSPDLGVEVRSDGTANGKFGPTTFKSTAHAALKKHP